MLSGGGRLSVRLYATGLMYAYSPLGVGATTTLLTCGPWLRRSVACRRLLRTTTTTTTTTATTTTNAKTRPIARPRQTLSHDVVAAQLSHTFSDQQQPFVSHALNKDNHIETKQNVIF